MNSNDFIIHDYLDLLTPSNKKGERNKYICPNCGGHNLSINKDGVKYDCFNCGDKSAIAKALVQLRGGDRNYVNKKTMNPQKIRSWVYTDVSGAELIKVVRTDDGNGNKKIEQYSKINNQWAKGYHDVAQSDVTLLYFTTVVSEAVASSGPLFLVEGESCVDALLSIGIKATTNIGGSNKNIDAYKILEDNNIVICPDRDKNGLAHTDKLGEVFPNAKWFYAFPQSPLWKNPPENKGLDVADYIHDLKAEGLSNEQIKERILSEVEDKKEFKEKVKPLDGLQAFDLVKNIFDLELSESEVTAQISLISKQSGINSFELTKYYAQLRKENIAKEDAQLAKKDLDSIKPHRELNLARFFPKAFVAPLNHFQNLHGSNGLAQLTAFLTACASLINPSSQLTLIDGGEDSFVAKPILFSALCGESGNGKSPTINLFVNPIKKALQAKAEKLYQQQKEAYDEWERSKDKDPDNVPPEPKPIEYYVTNFTSEFLGKLLNDQPNKGFLILIDELASLLNQSNAYRNGKGSDVEQLLSGRDGSGTKTNRKNGDRYTNIRSTYSILGGIQPDVLRKQMSDENTDNGYWQRFIFAHMPIKRRAYQLGGATYSIAPMLTSLYERLEAMKAINFRLDDKGDRIFYDFFNRMEDKRLAESNPMMRSIYSKYLRVAGELALILQCIDFAFHAESMDHLAWMEDNMILDPDFLLKGVELVEQYYIPQIESINRDADFHSKGSQYTKILKLSERAGWIKAHDLQRSDRGFRKFRPDEVRDLFKELEAIGKGKTKGKGAHIQFISNDYIEVTEEEIKEDLPIQEIKEVAKQSLPIETPPPKREVTPAPTKQPEPLEGDDAINKTLKQDGVYARLKQGKKLPEGLKSQILISLRKEGTWLFGKESGATKGHKVYFWDWDILDSNNQIINL